MQICQKCKNVRFCLLSFFLKQFVINVYSLIKEKEFMENRNN